MMDNTPAELKGLQTRHAKAKGRWRILFTITILPVSAMVFYAILGIAYIGFAFGLWPSPDTDPVSIAIGFFAISAILFHNIFR